MPEHPPRNDEEHAPEHPPAAPGAEPVTEPVVYTPSEEVRARDTAQLEDVHTRLEEQREAQAADTGESADHPVLSEPRVTAKTLYENYQAGQHHTKGPIGKAAGVIGGIFGVLGAWLMQLKTRLSGFMGKGGGGGGHAKKDDHGHGGGGHH